MLPYIVYINIDFPFAVHVCDKQRNVVLAYLSYWYMELVSRNVFLLDERGFLLNWVFPLGVRLMILLRFRTSRQFVWSILCRNSMHPICLLSFCVWWRYIEWRYIYKMHKMFLVQLLYSFALSRIGSGHLAASINAAHHVVIRMNNIW